MASGKSPGMLMRNAGIFNPVLVQAVGLCPVVAMATSVNSALLLAAVSAIIITVSEFIASLLLKSVPRWIRIGIYIILGAAIVSPLMIFIERLNTPLFSSLGIYLPIMAVNSLNVLRCERFAVKISPIKALVDGITASVGYSAVLLVVGFFRELLGSGSLLGKVIIKTPALSGLLLPFGGFLILGFAGAALRVMIANFWPKYLDKKQPKPGSKKKHRQEPVKKAANNPTSNPVPEFAADETLFTLEELDTITEDSATDSTPPEENKPEPPVQTETEPETATPASTEQAIEIEAEQSSAEIPAEKSPEEETTAEDDTAEETHADDTAPAEEEPYETDVPSEEQNKVVFADLTIDDIKTDENAEHTKYSDADEDLDALMNRSIDDILKKPKKEEDEE